jgi:hypothetical protein
MACGPVQSTSALRDAELELAAARQANAANRAPFETETASLYLHQARERRSRADYQASLRWARRAAACARVARTRAESPEPETAPSPRCPLVASAPVSTSSTSTAAGGSVPKVPPPAGHLERAAP